MIINSVVTNIQTGSDESIFDCKASNAYGVKTPNGFYYRPITNSYYYGKLLSAPNTDLAVNFSTATKWRVIVKFMFTETKAGSGMWTRNLVSNMSNYYPCGVEIEYDKNGYLASGYSSTSGTSSTDVWVYKQMTVTENVWFYAVSAYNNGNLTTALYNADGTLNDYATSAVANIYNWTFTPRIGGAYNNSYFTNENCIYDMNEMLYEKDGVALWGVTNSKTATMGVI